jgi:CheY-like chemotaxis protein
MTETYDLTDLMLSRTLGAMSEAPMVLVVDDNPESLKIAQRALRGLGAEVVTAGSVEEAREFLHWSVPSVIVTDLIFPTVSGFSLLETLRESARLRSVPTLVMSGWKNDVMIGKAQSLGAAEYLVKPFAPAVLREKVAAHL